MFSDMEMSLNREESRSDTRLLMKIVEDVSLAHSSSRPGRPPKRNSNHAIEDCLDDKRIKLSSSLLLRSFPDFANQSREISTALSNSTL